MDLGLKGKVALVTGGGNGIGAGICRALAQEGVRVGINFIVDREAVERFAGDLSDEYKTICRAFYADITQPNDLDQMIDALAQQYGRIDILVNNAGKCAGHA